MAESKDKAKDSPKDSKVFDVAKPGKTAPPLTSKPVIVTNRQVLKDPMVVDEEPVKQSEAEPPKPVVETPSATKVKIEPLSKPEDLKPQTDEESEAPKEADEATVDEDETDTGRDTIKNANTEEQELLDKKAAEHQANLEKIALAKTYYLPINQVERRRSKHITVAGAVLIILLGLVWADVALDAGLVTIPGVKAPTHFFSK
ncbi:MAG: hypothetical protein ACREGB_00770 [Candidatus Saccharimonadales bacterium]